MNPLNQSYLNQIPEAQPPEKIMDTIKSMLIVKGFVPAVVIRRKQIAGPKLPRFSNQKKLGN